jgi:signal transduction histidine kinase
MDRSALPRALSGDLVLRVALVLYALTAVFAFLGWMPVPGAGLRGGLGLVVVVLLAILTIKLGLRRSETATGIHFWRYVNISLVLWLASLSLSAAGLGTTAATALVVDCIQVTAYLVIILAAELRPDLSPVYRPHRRDEWLLLASAFTFVLALLGYCAVIPAWTDPAVYTEGRLSLSLSLFLALFLLMRFAYLGAWEPLAFYAFALPLLHLVLDYFGALSPQSRGPQEGLVILYFVFMGVLALAHSARRETRRRETATALQESERRYRRLIESHPDVILIEQHGALVYANATAIDKLNLRAPIEGLSLDLLGFPTLEMSGLGTKSGLPVDCHLVSLDGEAIDFEISYFAASYLGAPACQVIARDVTESRRLRAAAENTDRLAALGKISAAMAHEIRNPLAAIVMHCFFLAERLQKDDENLQILADINAGVDRMQKLVNGILGFVRPGELRLVVEDLIDIVESGLGALARQTDYSKIEIVREYRHHDAQVEVDVNQMVTVFLNIFDNAVRSMADTGTLTIHATNPDPKTIEVTIEDTGGGISSEDLEQIFEPFFTRRDDGIGIGLALVARTLAQHDCRYRVISEPLRGTRFGLSLALAKPATKAASPGD